MIFRLGSVFILVALIPVIWVSYPTVRDSLITPLIYDRHSVMADCFSIDYPAIGPSCDYVTDPPITPGTRHLTEVWLHGSDADYFENGRPLLRDRDFFTSAASDAFNGFSVTAVQPFRTYHYNFVWYSIKPNVPLGNAAGPIFTGMLFVIVASLLVGGFWYAWKYPTRNKRYR